MKILILASDNPNPPINGTRIRNYHLWPELRRMGHEVRVLALTRNPDDLKKSNHEIEYFCFSKKNILKRIWMRLFHSYHEWPVSDDLSQRVNELSESWRPEIIHAEELRMGYYLPASRIQQMIRSLCAHNVESNLIKKTLAAPFPIFTSFFNRIYQKNLIRFEKEMIRKTEIRFTYSENDKNIYETLYPSSKWHVSSNGVNLIELSEQEMELNNPENILFLGSLSYLPNIEAIDWYLENIHPLFKDKIKLTIAGSSPGEKLKEKLKAMQVKLIDTPLELKPVYLANSLLIVPLFKGSGTRGKIIESLMYNRPILTTTLGIEGLNFNEGQGHLIANNKTEFINSLERWLKTTETERQKIAQQGRAVVLREYTWKKVGEKLLKDWENLRA